MAWFVTINRRRACALSPLSLPFASRSPLSSSLSLSRTLSLSRPPLLNPCPTLCFLSCVLSLSRSLSLSLFLSPPPLSQINLVRTEIFGKFGETLKVGVPALLYFCQNTLFYVGSANMNAAPFQAALQFKVVTTAIVTVIFFRRCIKPLQWVAICGLMGGIVLVVLSNLKDTAPKPNTNPVIGYGVTLGICALAACASVYFEHILKGSSVSIWVRNIQLAMMSIVVAVITVFANDGAKIAQDGFFQGYTKWTCLAISIVAGGGLVIAMVLKYVYVVSVVSVVAFSLFIFMTELFFALFFLIRYASSILKTFATGSAIVVTGVISAFTPAMDFTPNMMFIGGALIVVGSIFAYGIAGQKKGPTAIVHASDSK